MLIFFSLSVEQMWENKRRGIVKPKKEKPEKVATRPRSKRISCLLEQRRKKQEQEEKRLIEIENEKLIQEEEEMELEEEEKEEQHTPNSNKKPQYVILAEQDWVSDQEEEF